MTQYEIRGFNPTKDNYDAIVEVYNQANQYAHGSADSWKHWDKNRAPERLFRRYVVEQEETIIGYGYSMRLDMVVNRFQFAIFLPPAQQTPDRIHDFYSYIINACQEYNAIGFISQVREDDTAKIDWMTQNGFQPVMRYPRSILDVPQFDINPYAKLFDKMAKQDIEIVSLAELSLRDPNWQRQVYNLDVTISEDVPSPHPYTHAPFHLYAQREFEDPHFMPEWWFMALLHGKFLGMTALEKVNEGMEIIQTSFTGVLPEYRRRGIASALKVRSFQVAQNLGVRSIMANNEENNPMYQINLALGFQPLPTDVDWERVEETIE